MRRGRCAPTNGAAPERDWNALGDEEFRALVRADIEEHYPTELRYPPGRLTWDEQAEWIDHLLERGWIAPGWPVEHGGMGLSPLKQIIFREEHERWGATEYREHGVIQVGPVIMRFGTEAQKQTWLPPIVRAEHHWAQGYSEPEAGSDLASLRTRARRDGDDYVVDGQKTWTTLANVATHIYLLVRTDPDAKKQEGISFLLADIATPGITVRPIHDIAGRVDFCEVFLEDVRIPVSNRIGEENQGWTIAKSLLGHERLTAGSPGNAEYGLEVLARVAEARGVRADPVFRDRYAAASPRGRTPPRRLRPLQGDDRPRRGDRPGRLDAEDRLDRDLREDRRPDHRDGGRGRRPGGHGRPGREGDRRPPGVLQGAPGDGLRREQRDPEEHPRHGRTRAAERMSDPVLEGIRVVEFSHLIAAPLCGLSLQDMGAEVIKVEPPEGDYTRTLAPEIAPGVSGYFQMLNRGKRGVSLDLRESDARELAIKLVDSADVVIESLGDARGAALGTDYEDARVRNPKLIWCSVTGTGRGTGGRAIDPTLQASMGMMALTGEPDRPPMRLPVPLVDFMTGMYAVQSVLAALMRVRAGGDGSLLDCAMIDSASVLTSSVGVRALNDSEPIRRMGTENPWYVPAANFEAADGEWVQLIAVSEQHWAALCEALGHPEWRDDPRFADNDARVANREAVHAAIAEVIRTDDAARWQSAVTRAGGFCQRIREIEEAWRDPVLASRGLVTEVDDPEGAHIPVISLADRDRGGSRPRAPGLGEHTARVAEELGVDGFAG